MIDQQLKDLAEKFGKTLADATIKRMMTAGAIGNMNKPETERKGRGGDSNGLLPGDAPDDKKFNTEYKRSIDRLTDSLNKSRESIIKRTFSSAKEFAKIPTKFLSGERKLDKITKDASEFGSYQNDMFKDIIDRTVEYIRKPNTDFSVISDQINALDEYNKKLHEYASNDEITKAQADELKALRQQIYNHKISVDLFKGLTSAQITAIKSIESKGFKSTDPKKIKAASDALGALSTSAHDSSTSIKTVTKSVADNMNAMSDAMSDRAKQIVRISAASFGAGMVQWFNDTVFQYQSSISEQFKVDAIRMGMSHRELQHGILEFRDVLRAESVAQSLDSLYDVDMTKIQELGKTFGYINDEAFKFGMQMKQSAQQIGLGADFSPDKMSLFYADAAKTLNMTAGEFGEYFNALSKDANFVGFVNTLRTTGDNVTDVLTAEIKNRIRMNKLLGLGNEELQNRINLENEKKWQPLAEKYKQSFGIELLMGQFEQELGLAFSDREKKLMKMYFKDPAMLTAKEREEISGPLQALLAAPAAQIEKYNKMYQAEPDLDKRNLIFDQMKGMQLEITKVFGDLAGKTGFDLAASENAVAMASKLNMGVLEYAKNLALMENAPKEFLDAVRKITGETEKPKGKGIDGLEGIDGFLINDATISAIQEIHETIVGTAQSGVAKTGLGIAGGIASMGWDILQMRMMHNLVSGKGVFTGMFSKAGWFGAISDLVGGTKAAVGSIGGFGKTVGSIATGPISKLGLVATNAAAALAGLAAWEAGKVFGDFIYQNAKDKDWFIDSIDSYMDLGYRQMINFVTGQDLKSPNQDYDYVPPEQAQMIRDRVKLNNMLRGTSMENTVSSMTDVKVREKLGQMQALKILQDDINRRKQNPEIIDEKVSSKGLTDIELLQKQADLLELSLGMSKEQIKEAKKTNAAIGDGNALYNEQLANAKARYDSWESIHSKETDAYNKSTAFSFE